MNPISANNRIFIRESWWPFVRKHTHPGNLAIHWLSFMLFYGVPIFAVLKLDFRLLILWPLSSFVGFAGHLIFERQDISLSDTVYSSKTMRCINRMFLRMVLGKYKRDLSSIKRRQH